MENRIFGRLTVVSLAGYAGSVRLWLCHCVCGKDTVKRENNLKAGLTQSCGCLHAEGNNRKHSNAERGKVTPEYRTWSHMKRRCTDANSKYFSDYGGRGISVCDSWMSSFENFLNDMGKRPSDKHSIDRIDVNGNYEPSNCRWATKEEQAKNTRRSRQLTFNGRTQHVKDWAAEIGMSHKSLEDRIFSRGWSVEEALTKPKIKSRYERKEKKGSHIHDDLTR